MFCWALVLAGGSGSHWLSVKLITVNSNQFDSIRVLPDPLRRRFYFNICWSVNKANKAKKKRRKFKNLRGKCFKFINLWRKKVWDFNWQKVNQRFWWRNQFEIFFDAYDVIIKYSEKKNGFFSSSFTLPSTLSLPSFHFIMLEQQHLAIFLDEYIMRKKNW